MSYISKKKQTKTKQNKTKQKKKKKRPTLYSQPTETSMVPQENNDTFQSHWPNDREKLKTRPEIHKKKSKKQNKTKQNKTKKHLKRRRDMQVHFEQ